MTLDKDIYTEFATGRMPVAPMKKVLRNLLIASGILFLIYSVLFYPILWTFSLLFFVAAYYYGRSLKYEMEYLLYEDDLHVDRIVANLKRKRKYAGNLNQLRLFTDDPKELEQFRGQGKRIRIRRLNSNRLPTYAMVMDTEDGLEFVYLNADEEMINIIRKRHPREVNLKMGVRPFELKEEPEKGRKQKKEA